MRNPGLERQTSGLKFAMGSPVSLRSALTCRLYYSRLRVPTPSIPKGLCPRNPGLCCRIPLGFNPSRLQVVGKTEDLSPLWPLGRLAGPADPRFGGSQAPAPPTATSHLRKVVTSHRTPNVEFQPRHNSPS